MTVNPTGTEDSPDPDAEETDVFLVLGADRRARKEEKEEKRRSTEEDSPLPRGASPLPPEETAPEPGRAGTGAGGAPPRQPVEDASPEGAAPAAPLPEASAPTAPSPDAAPSAAPAPVEGASAPSDPPETPGIPEAPYASRREPSVLRAEGELRTGGRPDVSAPVAAPGTGPQTSAATGIDPWIDAAGGGHVPVPGGYEQRIAAVRRIPLSPWRRAVFTVTGGRLNLG